MKHYEARLEADLNAIRTSMRSVAAQVEENLRSAAKALIKGDKELASETILLDHPVNRRIRRLDQDCHAFVARHWPGARHLRFISSVLRLNVELERIGDYAASICREVVQLQAPVDAQLGAEMEWLLLDSIGLLQEAVSIFTDGEDGTAVSVVERAAGMEERFSQTFEHLVRLGEEGLGVRDLLALLVILNRISRVRSQAKNVGEEALFVLTGQMKAPKTYSILFVDRSNDLLGPLAQACALKAFPDSGEYATAGLEPAEELSAQLEKLALDNGLTLGAAAPNRLNDLREPSTFNVIVLLEPLPPETVSPPPFHTVRLQWNIDRRQAPDEILNEISERIGSLMVTLCGEHAG